MGANENITWWQEIRGTAAVIRNLEASRAATLRLANSQTAWGRATEGAAHRGFLFNQVLFTGRRLLYAGTLATIAFAGAMSALGIQFNMSMESNRVALNHFLHSATLTNKELDYLFHVAAVTPFEMTDVTAATRKFLAFGFSLNQTNKYLNIIGDTVAGIGGSGADLEGLVTVFGQIQATGRAMGQDLLQLAQRGIPANKILKEQLGLTADQMKNIGQLAIPASVAIPALMRGMDKIFHGASAEQARTLQGQLSTLHDYAARLMGTLTLPMFNRLRTKIIPQMSAMVNEMQAAAKKGASTTEIVGIMDRHLKMGGRLLNTYKLLSDAFTIVKNVLVNGLIPALYITSKAFSGVYFVLLPLLKVLKFLTSQQWLLMGVLIPLIALLSMEATIYVLVRTAVISMMVVKFFMLRWTNLMIARQAVLNALQLINYARTGMQQRAEVALLLSRFKLYRVVALLIGGYKAWNKAAFASARLANGQFKAGYRYNGVLAKSWRLIVGRVIPATVALTTSIIAQTTALWAAVTAWIALNAVAFGWIVLSIAILATLIVLYFRWQKFHDIVNATWEKLTKFAGLVPVFGGLITGIDELTGHLRTLYNIAKKIYDLFRHPLHPSIGVPSKRGLLKSAVQTLNPFRHIPVVGKYTDPFHYFGAAGGVVPKLANVLVGENGPEILTLPATSRITPLPQPAFAGGHGGGFEFPRILNLRTTLEVDGRQLAEAVSRYRLDRVARR